MSRTITAIATSLGAGAVSIVRLSGDKALSIASSVFKCSKLNDFTEAIPNVMYLGTIFCEGFNDQCLAVYFKAPHSFTGEDVIEFQCHGGIRLTEEVLKTLIHHGAIIASRGEFTRTAFLNGKMSLSEAEGIVDMINSENIASLNAGYRMMSGHLNSKISDINKIILDITATLEASLDYPDEMEDEIRNTLKHNLNNIDIAIYDLLATANLGRIIRSGIKVAIIGEPNIGKSSLLNAILGRNRAIVTDIAGTTRDTLEERVEINGVFINFIDTAGIRQTVDIIEKIGVDLAYSSAASCDVVVMLMNANSNVTDSERIILSGLVGKIVIKVYNKSDLGVLDHCSDGITISARDKVGIDILLNKISGLFLSGDVDLSGDVLTSFRHIDAITRAYESVSSAVAGANISAPTECLLIDLRACYFALGEVTGDTASEDIIDKIFSKFCLGK